MALPVGIVHSPRDRPARTGQAARVRMQDLGGSTGGCWTRAQARAAGLSDDQVDRLRASGQWQVVRAGVVTDGGVELTPALRAWAAVVAAGGPQRAVAVGRSAARLHGLPLVDDVDPATGRYEWTHDDVAVRRRTAGRPTLHPRRWSYAPGELGTIGGCPVPSLARTLQDLRLVLRADALVCALDAGLHSGRVDRERLVAGVRPGARGLVAFRHALALADGRAESPLETLVRLLVLPDLPGLEPQVEVHDGQGRLLARIDLGDRRLRLGIEADGGTHRGPVSLAGDRQRERRVGWTFERVTWLEARVQQAATRRRLLTTAAALRARAACTPSPSVPW